ncbi:MAG: tetratricopeptide repeat protein [Chloroflexi bacterium]|nr:tetratricopeptide repeat protein [Chloroflexota bacterium]
MAFSRPVVAYWPVLAAALVAGTTLAIGWLLLPTDQQLAEAHSLNEKTVQHYRLRAAEANPDQPELLIPLAEGYVLAGEQAKALESLEKFLSSRPDDTSVLRQAATLADWELQPDRAAGYRQRIRNLDPTDLDVRERLGIYLMLRQRTEEAMDVYLEILAVEPDNHELLMRTGDLLTSRSRFNEAIELYQRASTINPTDVEVLLHIGRAYRWVPDELAAINVYERATEVDQNSQEAWSYLSLLYWNAGEFNMYSNAEAEIKRISSNR